MNNPPSKESSPGHLLSNLVLFGRFLREFGFDITPGLLITAIQSLEHIDIGSKQDFYFTLQCTLVHRRENLALFDWAFHQFWRRQKNLQKALDLPQRTMSQASSKAQVIPLKSIDMDNRELEKSVRHEEGQDVIIEAVKTYSNIEILRAKDFSEMSQEEIETVKSLMAELIVRLGYRQTRRYRPGKGPLVDIRRSLRSSLRFGGEILLWSRKEAKSKPRPLILIADISGSMDRYSRMLLHFLYSLTAGLDRSVESFVFSTRLTHVTKQIKGNDVERAMSEISHAVPDWSGGTRIGLTLKKFNYIWARRVLSRGAVVIIISDGWDRGEPDLLAQEMARLQRSCFRLIWLNPLLGLPEYQPRTKGMITALPFVDDFLTIHNLQSIEDLAVHLFHLDDRRPSRRQQPHQMNRLMPVHNAIESLST